MAEAATCPACGLRHTVREGRICPRCHNPIGDSKAPGSSAGSGRSGDGAAQTRPGLYAGISRQKPRTWLVWLGAVVVLGAAAFVGSDEGIGTGLLVLFVGAVPLVTYWYYRIRPWEEDAEVLRATLGAMGRAALRRGRVSQEDAAKLREQRAAARRRWDEQTQGRK